MGNLNPYTWVSPAATTGTMGMIFNSLTQWLLNPQFPQGIYLGDIPPSSNSLPSDSTTVQVGLGTGTFTSTATAGQAVPHGLVIGAVLFSQAYARGNSGEHFQIVVSAVDATNVFMDTSGVPAGRGCHYALIFTPDPAQRGW